MTSIYEDKRWFNSLAISGALFNGLFSLIIWYTKKLNLHPMRLLMMISLSESIWCYSLFMLRNLCILNLDKLFLYSTFQEIKTDNQVHALAILYWVNILIEQISVLMSVYLNIYLVIDFVMTLRYPFKAKKRLVTYTLTCLAISIICFFFIYFFVRIFIINMRTRCSYNYLYHQNCSICAYTSLDNCAP